MAQTDGGRDPNKASVSGVGGVQVPTVTGQLDPWLTWSQSATPNGCNAWLLPEDIFKIDRICTPLPILCQFALNLEDPNLSSTPVVR